MQANSSKTVDTGFLGNIRRDNFGRIVVDLCSSDLKHLRDSKTDPIHNRPMCRRLIEEAFEPFVGRSGRLTLTVAFDEEAVGAVPQDIFTATTREVDVAPHGRIEEAVLTALEQVDGQ